MTLHAEVGHGEGFVARIDTLEREAATLRAAIERARAAVGDDGRAYARRLYEENETLRRENAELEEKIRGARALRRKGEALGAFSELFEALEKIFLR